MLMFLGYCTLLMLAVGGWQARAVLREYLDTRRTERDRELALQARKLDLEERAIAITENKQRSPSVPVSIPPDLYRRITRWDSPEAQDSERKILLDLYNDFHNAVDPWVEVRAHLPAEPRDEIPTELFQGLVPQ